MNVEIKKELEKKAIKKAELSLSGNFDKILMNGKKFPSREDVKKLDPQHGVVYLGRNSNKEKCISCSKDIAGVHWMHVSFNESDLMQDLWICESCTRSYPSKKGSANFKLMKNKKK